MRPRAPYPFLYAIAIIIAAALPGATKATAQSVDADQVKTTLSLDAQHFPVTITHLYRLGRVQTTYTSNGSYSQPAAEGLGHLESMVIFGTTLHLGIIDNETTPGTGRAVLVSFTSAQEPDGTTSVNIEAQAVD